MSNTSVPAARTPAGAPPGGLSHRQILVALSGLLLAVLVGALDQTIVSTAMRTIADELHGGTTQSWATTGYLVSSTVAMPFYGRLSDIYGRKPLYLASLVIFIVGSVACAFADSMVQLAAFRVVQGLGGAGLLSMPTAIVADLAPARERGRYFAFLQIAWAAASLLGPLAGGAFAGVDALLGITGWRWVFLINLPLGLLALVTVYKVLSLPHEPTGERIDYPGAATLSLGLVPLLVVVAQGVEWGWTSAASLTMYVLGAAGLLAFGWVERRAGDAAMLPPRLFRRGGITLAVVTAGTVGVGIFGTSTILPLFLQLVQGHSPTVAGLVVVPFMGGSIVAAMVSGMIISRTGRFKATAVTGLALMTLSNLGFAVMTRSTPLWQVGLDSLVSGIGIGLAVQVLTLAVQTSAPRGDLGVANGAAGLVRQLGGALGVSVFLSVVFGVAATRVSGHDLNDTSFLRHLDPAAAGPVLSAFTEGFRLAFGIGALLLAAGTVMTFFFRELSEDTAEDGATKDDAEDG
ncbi:MDR family MFS transporter [Actinomadura kijaniata]|uniref:MDR family MFS transporter n=1 Tax=Actinomadura kijaniata TaxID=46161 RepID=UPI003F1CDA8B